MRPTRLPMLLALLTMTALPGAFCQARDYPWAVGSSTVFPFATVVAEQVGQDQDFKTPRIEAWGSGGGAKLFCHGLGADEVDVALMSREMTPEELSWCQTHGVGELLQLRFGSDGITLVTPRDLSLELSREDLYLALAREVPDPGNTDADTGTLIENPYQRWNQINPALPDAPIKVYGPPPTSGTYDLLIKLALEPGCRRVPQLSALESNNPERFRTACGAIREDGQYVASGENDNLIVRKVAGSNAAVGILGFSYYDQNRDQLNAATIDGIAPDLDSIYTGHYPLSRPLFIYVKSEQLAGIPGLRRFLEELLSPAAAGEEGYLLDHGLVPLPEQDRADNAQRIRAMK